MPRKDKLPQRKKDEIANDKMPTASEVSYIHELLTAKSREITELRGALATAQAQIEHAREILSENDPSVAQMEPLDRLAVAIRRMQRAYDALEAT